MSDLKKFVDLPLGTKFRHEDGKDVYVVLETHGRGKVAEYQGVNGCFATQCVYSAGSDEEETRALEVIVVEDNETTSIDEDVRANVESLGAGLRSIAVECAKLIEDNRVICDQLDKAADQMLNDFETIKKLKEIVGDDPEFTNTESES